VTLVAQMKKKIGGFAASARNEIAAQHEKAESDVASDPHVAGSRAGDNEEDGDYVGRTGPDSDSQAEQTGAEARSEARRQSGR
jgi:hypothetical protein